MNKNGSKTGLLLSIQFLYNLIYGVKYVANGFILMVFGVWYHILSDFNWKIQTWNFYDSLFSIWGHTQTMWTALRLRGLWNVHFTNKAYLAKMSSKGEGGSNKSKKRFTWYLVCQSQTPGYSTMSPTLEGLLGSYQLGKLNWDWGMQGTMDMSQNPIDFRILMISI